MTTTPSPLKTLMQVPSPAPLMTSPAALAAPAPSVATEQLEQQRQRLAQTALNLSPANPTSVPQEA
jgi:hypothetical protein